MKTNGTIVHFNMKALEDHLQAECVRWFRYQYPNVVIFAIPNGGSRNPIEAAKLKRTGTLAGVADLFVMKAKWVDEDIEIFGFTDYYCKYHGLFIEMKVGKNKQTPAQVEFQEYCQQAGYEYQVCRSFDEFKEVIENYLK